MVFYAPLVCSGEKLSSDHDRRECGGSKIEKESDSFIGVSFWKRGKEGKEKGFLHMCITNIGQKNLSTNKGLQSNVHESTGLWRHGEGIGDWRTEREGG